MADEKVLEIAKAVTDSVRNLVDFQLKEALGGATLKSDPKKYYKMSRQVFKAVVAAAAQRMMDDGANSKLVEATLHADDAWALFLSRNPKLAAKLALPEPKVPPKPLALKLIEGGMAALGMKFPISGVKVPMPEVPASITCECSCHGFPVTTCGNCSCYLFEEPFDTCKDCGGRDSEHETTCPNTINELNGDEVL